MNENDGRALEALESDWVALRDHHRRGALFVVAPELDPLVVARAVASDAVEEVRAHLEAGRLRPPSADEAERWSAEPEAHRFRFYIVQPYVVAQRIEAVADA